MPLLFAVTLFVSATLLFLVQPLIAKMILPKFGGTPAVWNTCMVFFQALLLAGYSYAHWTTTWLGVRKQTALHLILLLLPVIFLPFAVSPDWAPPEESNPIPPLLGLLLISVGLPFFLVSTSAPLLQKWFASTGHPSAKDPYFLYAASNVGSMLALLAYPALLEPNLRLQDQSWIWAAGYGLLVLLTAACARAVWTAPEPAVDTRRARQEATDRSEAPTTWRRVHWVLLAFAPSSLMLGVTTYLSTDIAAIPLIWVIPLALYLLSFILVFARLPDFVHQLMVLTLPVLVLLQVFLTLTEMTQRTWVVIVLHLLMLFVAAMVCHGELAKNRPSTRYLTEFYLWMSLGGVLGGLFNSMIAPLIFKTLLEYPVAMVMACMLMPALSFEDDKPINRWVDYGLLMGLGLFTIALGIFVGSYAWVDEAYRLVWTAAGLLVLLFAATITPTYFLLQDDYPRDSLLRRLGPWCDILLPAMLGLLTLGLLYSLDPPRGTKFLFWIQETFHSIESKFTEDAGHVKIDRIRRALEYGIPALICYLFVARPIRFGLALAALLAANTVYSDFTENDAIYRARSFFGTLKLEETKYENSQNYHRLVHGTTLHGKQSIDENGKPVQDAEPLTYYHRTGPIGEVFAAFAEAKKTPPVALIGLGTGTLASYGQKGQEFTFYEIDPAVVKIATNPDYFSYVEDAKKRGVDLKIVLGDARLSLLRKAPDNHYGLIIVDAFSSDAIPVHLITKEALQLYLKKLAPGGIIAFHISNRYLDLEPVLANLAKEKDIDIRGTLRRHDNSSDDYPGKSSSNWVMLARQPEDFGTLGKDDPERWHTKLDSKDNVGVWTDDFSNILRIFMWGN